MSLLLQSLRFLRRQRTLVVVEVMEDGEEEWAGD
jgi:hypothetical protein